MTPAFPFFRRLALALLLAAAALSAAPVQAATDRPTGFDGSGDYASCMQQIERDPTAAFEWANGWIARGGGLPARHCLAVAMVRMGHSVEGAKRLEDLAKALEKQGSNLVADVLNQAGNAWMIAGDAKRAASAQSNALKFRPGDPDILLDRAQSLAATKNYWEAIDDLNHVIDRVPNRPDAYILRGTAYRYVDSLDLAGDDLERALKIDPRATDALLERGIVRRLKKNTAGARTDWLRVLALEPTGPTADAARANLEKLDVKTR